MKKLALAVVGVLVLLVAAALIAPSFIDWNKHRADIAAQLASVTGRQVAIDGALEFSLLPSPVLRVGGIRVANVAGASEPEMLRLAELDVKVALAPLLGGRVAVSSLKLVKPVVTLERLADGRASWDLPAAEGGAEPGRGSSFAIASIAIEDGTVAFRQPGSETRVEHINATGSMDSAAGPFRAKGTASWQGRTVAFDGESGRIGGERIPLHLVLDASPAARVELAGDLGGGSVTGRLTLAGQDLGALAALAGAAPLPVAAKSYSLSGALTASAERVALADMAVALDDSRGNGSLTVALGATPEAELRLALASLDLDRLTAAPSAPGAAAAPAPGSAGFALPADVSARVSLAVEALAWRKQIVRQARLEAALDGGELHLDRVSGLLPGEADLSLTGTLSAKDGQPRLAAVAEIEADSLRGLLDWLGVPTGSVPNDRLRKASVTARVTATPQALEIASLELAVDASKVTGAATVALRDRPAIGARIVVDRINLDAYLPQPADASPGTNGTAPPQLDANLDITVQSLVARGQPVQGVHVVGTLQAGEIRLREASVADAGGASAKLSGLLTGLGTGEPRIEAAVEAAGPQLERTIRLLGSEALGGRRLGEFRLGARVTGGLAGLDIDGEASLLGTALTLKGPVQPAEAGFKLAVTLHHPSLARLLGALSPGWRPAGGDPGALDLAGTLTGTTAKLAIPDLALSAGASKLTGSLALDRGGARPKLSGNLSFTSLPIDRFLPARQSAALMPGIVLAQAGRPSASSRWSREPIDLSSLSLLDAELELAGDALSYGAWRLDGVGAHVTLTDGLLDLPRLSGRLFEGTLTGKAQVNGPGRAFSTELRVAQAELKSALSEAAGLGRVEGKADLDLTLQGAGATQAALVESLSGAGRIAARDGVISGIDLDAMSERLNNINRPTDLLALLGGAAGGATRFSSLQGSFKVENGVATSNDLTILANSAEGHATALVDLPRWQLQSRATFRLTQHPKAPPIAVTLEGPLDEPRKVFDTNALQQFLAQRGLDRLLQNRPSAPEAGTPQPGEAQKPEKAIRDLFRGLLR